MAKLTFTPRPAISATVSRYPESDVLPGEVVTFRVEGVTGSLLPISQLDFVVDYDDAGATYDVSGGGQSSDASYGVGRVVSHAYETTGEREVMLMTRRFGQNVAAIQTVSVNVVDPDAIAWDNDLYVDFGEVSGSPDFTQAPAEGGAVQHISSLAELLAVPIDPTDSTRITFKRGETFTWGADSLLCPGRCYVTGVGFGSGDRPKVVGGAPGDVKVFNPQRTGGQSHFATYAVDYDGKYDPVQGDSATGGYMYVVSTPAALDGDLYRSFAGCVVSGTKGMYQAQGTNNLESQTERTFLGVCNVKITDWQNFGIGAFGSNHFVFLSGVAFPQNPLAIIRDDKVGSLPEAGDHGPIRAQPCQFFGAENCLFGNSTGWSSFGSDRAIQPSLRIIIAGGNIPYDVAVVNVQRCVHYGSNFIGVGRNNEFDTGVIPRLEGVVERNLCIRTRQHQDSGFITTTVLGLTVRNNVFYLSNLYSAANKNNWILDMRDSNPEGQTNWTYLPTYGTEGNYLGFNTIVSDASEEAGDTEDFFMVEASGWTGEAPTIEHNIVHVPNHANGGTFTDYTPLDRASAFRPATGSAAIDAITSGVIPIRDFDSALREATTNIGAHDSESATAGTVAAPVNTSPPTIAELASFPGEYHATSFGEWENWSGDDLYLVEWSWHLDGVPVADDYLTVFDSTGQTGDLTLVITATNRSGVRVASTASAPITLS